MGGARPGGAMAATSSAGQRCGTEVVDSEVQKRLKLVHRRIAEVEEAIGTKGGCGDDADTLPNGTVVAGSTDRVLVRFPDGRGEVLVVIGTSEHLAQPGFADRVAHVVDSAYTAAGKHKRMDSYDASERLEMGDDGIRANRVLHLAYIGDVFVGCASSTFSPGWTPEDCGHWGLLAVDPAYQGKGVATALVLAAERRLATVSEAIQIEYQFTDGEEFSTRLMSWYEDKMGFDGGRRPSRTGQTCFRRCFKQIAEDSQRKGQRRRLVEIRAWLQAQAETLEQEALRETDAKGNAGGEQGAAVQASVGEPL